MNKSNLTLSELENIESELKDELAEVEQEIIYRKMTNVGRSGMTPEKKYAYARKWGIDAYNMIPPHPVGR